MPKALALIPRASAAEPSSIMLAPAWLSEQMHSVSDLGSDRITMEEGRIVKRTPTMPAHLIPTDEQRSLISQHIAELKAMARLSSPREIAPVIGELLLAYSPQRADAQTTAAKTKGYLEALFDVPLWATREALARWQRGEAGGDIREDEYSFAPSTARLRRIALRIASVAAGKAMRLERVLEAEPDYVPTEGQREANATGLEQAARDVEAASSMAPAKPAGRTPAEQDAVTLAEAARWQRWLEKNPPQEAQSDA